MGRSSFVRFDLPRFVAAMMLASCAQASEPSREDMSIAAPGKIRHALALIADLGAKATLVSRGGDALASVPLARGDDGVSFSAFIAADPGDYTLEIAFDGVAGGRPGRAFLGRWTSDAFTVAAGGAVTPAFSQPLDTIGRTEDHGDDDGDGLGLLDELLWGADPANADSDGDAIPDGRDCDPADAMRTFAIVAGASIEDCDGDGSLRPDLSYRVAGDDCDDRDPSVHPGAHDDCSDAIDQDCNTATCPPNDLRGPAVTILEPTDGETVGCHRKIRARVEDDGVLGEVDVVRYDGSPPSFVERIPMRRAADAYEIDELNVSTHIWMEDGPELFAVKARDDTGNTTTASIAVVFDLDLPEATISPAVVGMQSAPFDVVVTASAPHGIASIRLMRAPVQGGAYGERSGEVELGRATASPATFHVDPAAVPDGEYALYPIVVDAIGNRLDPEDSFSIESLPSGELFTDPYYICVFDPGPGKVPVRQLVVGGGAGPAPAKMRDHFDEALALAAARDPNAQLVEIRGEGLEPDGFVRLDQAIGGDGKLWRYHFFNFTDDRDIAVTWYSAAWAIQNPEVDVEENSPFGYAYEPFANQSALVDSDVAVTAYRAASGGRCPQLTGLDTDILRYESDQPFTAADVIRVEVGMNTWKATATPPITEIWSCP